jgi:uncharacterized protein involved in exopolysaccharide biosynthesis
MGMTDLATKLEQLAHELAERLVRCLPQEPGARQLAAQLENMERVLEPELKELVGRARLEEHEKVISAARKWAEIVKYNARVAGIEVPQSELYVAVAKLEAAIGKPAGKDFIPPQGGEHRD